MGDVPTARALRRWAITAHERDKVMRKEVQEALESAIAGFEKRQRAEQERLRERESDWARIRTAVVPRWY
jgi:hypothetical protein